MITDDDRKGIGKETGNSNLNEINKNEIEKNGKKQNETQKKIENNIRKEEKDLNNKQIIDEEKLKNENNIFKEHLKNLENKSNEENININNVNIEIKKENKIENTNNIQNNNKSDGVFDNKADKQNRQNNNREEIINNDILKLNIEKSDKNNDINIKLKDDKNMETNEINGNNKILEEAVNKLENNKIIDRKDNEIEEKNNNIENDKKGDINNKVDNEEKIFINNKKNNQDYLEIDNNIKKNNIDNNRINNIQEDINNDAKDSSDEEDDNYNEINYYQNNSEVCGIKNLGNNCYLNSGLQILASCEELVKLLDSNKYENLGEIVKEFKKALKTLLNKKIYNPKKFIDCFCKLNKDFIKGSQNCSQNFIRTILRNINIECVNNRFELITKNNQYSKINNNECEEYEKFIKQIFPESKIVSLFSVITKSHSFGNCPYCKHNINDYSFNYFIDQSMYLDEFDSDCLFSDVLNANLGNNNILTMDCPKCNEEINIKEEVKIIKLPDILIFTLERYQGPTNTINIIPDIKIDMKKYIDSSLNIKNFEYELFAINIRFGSTANSGHEICQVKRGEKWYQINDRNGKEIKKISYFNSSYGLFYRIIKSENIQSKYIDEYEGIIELNDNPNIIKLKDNPNSNEKSICNCSGVSSLNSY